MVYDISVEMGPLSDSFESIVMVLDPHLFSVYYRHEKIGASFGDVGWIALAGTLGVEVCRISTTWAVALESVKATGVIFLLGVGSLMFYKLYHFCCTRRPRPPEHSPTDHGSVFHRPTNLHFSFSLADASEGEDAETLKGLYFGPRSPACDDEVTHRRMNDAEDESISPSSSSYGGTSGDEDADISEGSNIGDMAAGYRDRSRDSWSPPVRQRSQTLHKTHSHPVGHRLNSCCPRGWKRPRHFSTPVSNINSMTQPESWFMGRIRNIVMPSFIQKETKRDAISLPATPGRGKLKQESVVEADWIEGWRLVGRQAPDGAETNKSSRILLPAKKFSIIEEPTESLIDPKILSDESYDCSGFSDNGNGESGQNILREGSFDSTCSDLSLDFSLRETMDTSTMACMEKLQKEIDQLKTNCLIMDEEFETIKCNRNLPGMSSLMKSNIGVNNSNSAALESNPSEEMESVKKEKAKECFAGLYSLITIKNSTSSELSDSFPPPCGRVSVGSAESLEWDSPKVTSPLRDVTSIREENSPITDCAHTVHGEGKSLVNVVAAFSNPLAPCEDEAMVSLEWDNDDLVEYPEEDIHCYNGGEGLQAVISSDIEFSYVKELKLPKHSDPQLQFSSEAEGSTDTINYATGSTERLCGSENHEAEGQMADSMMSMSMMSSQLSTDTHYQASNLEALPLWSSEESGYMDWDGRCDGNRSSQWPSPLLHQQAMRMWGENSYAAESSCDTSEPSTPASKSFFSWNEPKVKSIGDRIEVREYAKKEWLNPSQQTQTLIEAYHEIPSTLGLDYVRRIREDNFSALRATIFQTLTQSIAVPSGSETYQKLLKAHGEGCHWLQDWKFPNNLPYCKDNVLQGMKLCLEKLDSLAAMVAISNDKETTLAGLLNADASLDLHVVEAVKLHMLLCAMELHAQNTSGAEVPLFAILLFARDTSETPKDFMNNHLRQVGNFGGMEQVEMFLLGYTLGVTLQVVRPFYYGTKEYICRYPDWNAGTWPQVTLIAENDLHYNVLLK